MPTIPMDMETLSQVVRLDEQLPDMTTLLLGMVAGLAFRLLPAMFSSHLGNRRKRATSEEIEQMMVYGMVEVPPPDLTRPEEQQEQRRRGGPTRQLRQSRLRRISQQLIDYLAAEAMKSEEAARRLEQEGRTPRRPAVVVADFSRESQERQTKEKEHTKDLKKYRRKKPHGSKHRLLKKPQVRKNAGGHPTIAVADFSINSRRGEAPGARRAEHYVRTYRSLPSKGDEKDRNRMDEAEDMIYSDIARSNKQKMHAEQRQGPAGMSTMDHTMLNQGGLLGVVDAIGSTLFRIGVSVAFFLL